MTGVPPAVLPLAELWNAAFEVARTVGKFLNQQVDDDAPEDPFELSDEDIANDVFDPDAMVDQLPKTGAKADLVRGAVQGDRGEVEIPSEDIKDPNRRGEDKTRYQDDKVRVHYWRDPETGATYGGKIVRRFE